MQARKYRKGTVLVIAMIFMVVFSAFALALASFTGGNVQIANNYCKANQARASAESGLEIVRYWLDKVALSGTIAQSQIIGQIASQLEGEFTLNNISNINVWADNYTVYIPTVYLDNSHNDRFWAYLQLVDADTVRMYVTGYADSTRKTICVNYELGERANNVFDFGVATKGPLSLAGNIELEGYNVSVEASVYIESENSNLALSIIGNSQIAGDVSIVNSLATVDLQGGQAGIGGETGQDAIDNHVNYVSECEFPEPVPSYFEQYLTAGNVVDANTDTTADATFENIRILANSNPTFSGHVTLNGIVYIETPNIVQFTGTADVTGIIVGDGDFNDDSGTNQIIFQGDVSSTSVTELQGSQFTGITEETGTFVVAPGFAVSFGGSFDTLNGAIAANGVEFFGNAGGIINGSVINYSDEQMELSGNSDLYFNRSGIDDTPAGFVPEIILIYDPGSYSEMTI